MKILNTEPILCDIRGLRYLQTKWDSETDNFGPLRVSQGMTRPVGSQLGHLKANLALLRPL